MQLQSQTKQDKTYELLMYQGPLADYLKPNPWSLSTIIIPPPNQRQGQDWPLDYPSVYNRIKEYLKAMLQAGLAHHQANPTDPTPASLIGLTPAQLVSDLKNQLEAYLVRGVAIQ